MNLKEKTEKQEKSETSEKLEIKKINCGVDDCNSYPVTLKNQIPTKWDLRIMMFEETGNERFLAGVVDDNIAAVVSEILSSGMIKNDKLSVISRDSNSLPMDKESEERVFAIIRQRLIEVKNIYQGRGLAIDFAEHVPKNMTLGLDIITSACLLKNREFNSVNSGDVIYGFASNGQAVWENTPRSGLESYGIDFAQRHLLSDRYGEQFKGNFLLSSRPTILKGMSVGEALTSPTRHYGLIIKALTKALKKTNSLDMLHGAIHNTNNGVTKIANSPVDNIHGGLFFFESTPREVQIPPIFRMIQSESGLDWGEMYSHFSCGIGLKIIGENNSRLLKALREVEKSCGVKLYPLGEVLKNTNSEGHSLMLNTPFKAYHF